MANREKAIVRIGFINVVGNLILAAMKITVGAITKSIAVTLDGIDSLADGFSSALTIVGTKIAQRPADHEHPFGHGRFEYLTSFVVAALIIAAGGSSLSSAIHAIMNHVESTYSTVSLIVIGLGAATKAGLGVYTRSVGTRLKSSPLVANGTDSILGSVVSLATLVAAILNITLHISIESILAAGISILIIKTGVGILIDTVSKLMGERQDPALANRVEKVARSVDGVRFASGVVLMDFGPSSYGGTMYITVDGSMTVSELDVLTREVESRVEDECGVKLVTIGAYPAHRNTSDEIRKARAKVSSVLWGYEHVMEIRGLYVDTKHYTCSFDAVVDFSVVDVDEYEEGLCLACQKALPGYQIESRVVRDVGD